MEDFADPMTRLLVIDDEPAICWTLEQCGKGLGHTVQTASSAEQGMALAEETAPDVIVLDVRLPGIDGISAMAKLRKITGDCPVIVITAYGDLKTAVGAVQAGAFEYLIKPFSLSQIESVLQRALTKVETTAGGSEEETSSPPQVDGIVGKSPAMQEVFKRIALAAPREACVLLRGESGSGKELAARAIHRYSARSSGPFVAVNMASLSATLAESELFGHVKGAFTGASEKRSGLLQQASGGTLFLDEVADIPLPVQVKLLRCLEHGEVTPVGSGEAVKVDFRVVSATHRDLSAMIAAGEFRHDLFYRLCAFQIDLPPLRERDDDLRELAQYFTRSLAQDEAAPVLADATLDELARRPWHGNVRELRNAIEHALILARDGVVLPEHLPPQEMAAPGAATVTDENALHQLIENWAKTQLADAEDGSELYDQLLTMIEPPLFSAAIARHRGQIAAAARVLGLHRTTLKKKIEGYGLQEE